MSKVTFSSHKFNRYDLEEFASTWPCFGLPDNVAEIMFQFDDRNGDLVDVEARDTDGNALPSGWDDAMDGSGLVALSHDASDKLYPKDS